MSVHLANIWAEMRRQNITGLAVAEKLGIHSNTFYRKMSGKTEFKSNEIIAFAEILNVEVSFFLENLG